MAKAKVVNSEDTVTVIFKGDKNNPEPSTGIIKFPGGNIEVSRCHDGTYWAHLNIEEVGNIIDSRMDVVGVQLAKTVHEIPYGDQVNHFAIKVSPTPPTEEDAS